MLKTFYWFEIYLNFIQFCVIFMTSETHWTCKWTFKKSNVNLLLKCDSVVIKIPNIFKRMFKRKKTETI